MRVYVFKFRPSSHSEDYTIVSKFKTRRKAEEAYNWVKKYVEGNNIDGCKVDWDPSDAWFCLNGKTVKFGVSSGSSKSLDPVIDRLEEAEELGVYTDYQELAVTVALPKGLTFESAMLVLPGDEAEMLKELKNVSEETRVTETEEHRFFIFTYKGEAIFNENEGELWVGNTRLDVLERANWEVTVYE